MFVGRFRRVIAYSLAAIFLGAAIGTRADAQDAGALDTLTRAEVVRLAKERAPQVLEADARILESRGRLIDARIFGGNPTLEAVTGSPPNGQGRRTSAELSMPIGLGFKRARRIRAASAELRGAEDLARDARRLAIGAALEAYYSVLHALRRLDVARERSVLAEQLLDAVETRFSSGDVGGLDLKAVETEVSRSRSEILLEELNVTQAKADLAFVLGLATTSGLNVVGDLADRSFFDSSPEDPDPSSRPDVQAAESQLTAAEAERSLAATAIVPDIEFRLDYDRDGDDSVWMPGIGVSLPIFDRGQGWRAQASARQEQARLELQRRRAAATLERHVARESYLAAVASVRELEDRAVPSALEVERMTEQSYLSGKTDLGSILILRRESLATRLEYVDRLLDAALRGVDLALAIGIAPEE